MSESKFLDVKNASTYGRPPTPQRATYDLLKDMGTKNFVALLIHYKGKQKPNYHYHAIRETIYIGVEGSGTLLMDGVEYEMKPGKYAWVPPGAKHTIIAGEESEGLKMYEIYCGKGDPMIMCLEDIPEK